MTDQKRGEPYTAQEAYQAGNEDFNAAIGIVNRLVASGKCLKEKFADAMTVALNDLMVKRFQNGQLPSEDIMRIEHDLASRQAILTLEMLCFRERHPDGKTWFMTQRLFIEGEESRQQVAEALEYLSWRRLLETSHPGGLMCVRPVGYVDADR